MALIGRHALNARHPRSARPAPAADGPDDECSPIGRLAAPGRPYHSEWDEPVDFPSTLLQGSASHLVAEPGGAERGVRTSPRPRAGPLPNP